MSRRYRRRQNDAGLPSATLPVGEWDPVTAHVDPDTGQPHKSPYGAAEQVPRNRVRRHRSDGSAHGRHVRRDEGKGHGSWSEELRSEVTKFTGVGWIGLSASIVGSVVFNSATAGFLSAFAIAPLQGVIAGIVNILKLRKEEERRREELRKEERQVEKLSAEVQQLRDEVANLRSGGHACPDGQASARQPAPETGTPPGPAPQAACLVGVPPGLYPLPYPSYFVVPNGFYGPPPGYGVSAPSPGQVPTAPVPVYHPYATPVAVAVAVPVSVYHQAPSGQGMASQTAAQPRRGEDPRAPTNQEPRGHTPPTL